MSSKNISLKEAAEKLRDYLVEHDYAGDDGDIPDSIWIPFCEELRKESICSSDPCDYCVHKDKQKNCNPCYEHAAFQGLRVTK